MDENREWTPARVEPTGDKEKNGDAIYKKTAVSDHMAIEAEIKINIVLPGRSGNIPVINYNTDDGWTKYKKLSDKYAPDIRRIIKTHKDKNERQDAFKELLHKLDIEAFGIKFRKSKSIQKRIGKYKAKELKTLSQIVKEKHKSIINDINKLKKITP